MHSYEDIKYITLFGSSFIGTGSVYTVWGRKNCPAINGTTTVYTGEKTFSIA